MSTRSTTHFIGYGDSTPAAKVYRHSDGYPEGHGVDMQRFFADVEAETQDTRYSDPSYLASKLVVWLARQFGSGLNFLSVGVVIEDPSDIEFVYVVDCGSMDAAGRPVVTCHEVDHSGGWDAPVTLGAVVPIPVEATR